jgi:DUF1680 family protein
MLYNAVNVGMSLDGKQYCYANPLESPGKGEPNWHSKEGTTRNPWYDVLCCPPNIQRTFGALPGYMYSTSKDGIYVHLYDNSLLDWHLENGMPIKIDQKTGYPWAGNVELTVSPGKKSEFTLYVRIPGWASSAKVRADGKEMKNVQPGTYLPIRRTWEAGDRVQIDFDMTSQFLTANPRVSENVGKVAVQRGPLVYTLEQLDQPAGVTISDVALPLPSRPAGECRAEHRANLLDGVTVVRCKGFVFDLSGGWSDLYLPAGPVRQKVGPATELTFIPYYAWANREPAPMKVWVPVLSAGGK